MQIKFTNPDPRDFPTLGLFGMKAGDTAEVPTAIARDLKAQGVALATKPATKGAKPDKNEE